MKKTYMLTHLSLLLAIAVLLSMLGFMIPIAGISGLKVTFAFLPIMLAGIVFGPAAGAIVGVLTDILGYITVFHAYGPWFPGFTVTLALTGALPALILNWLKNQDQAKLWKLVIAVGFTSILTTLINTYFVQILYGKAFMVILPIRLLKEAIFLPIEIISLNIVVKLYRALLSQSSNYEYKF
jgi:ECF transporter S component (folate family)